MICEHILMKTLSNEPEFIFCTQLNVFKNFYQTQTIIYTINHLFAHS